MDVPESPEIAIKAREAPPPRFRVEMPDGGSKAYVLVNPTAEQLITAKAKWGALTDDERGFDLKAWVDLLALFMRREDALRFLKEQTIATVKAALLALTQHAQKELGAAD